MSGINSQNTRKLPSDNPIVKLDDDVLQRTSAAENFVKGVLNLDASRGATVGVFGSWGSGKTSFINLARQSFEREQVPVLDFNPWLFSGTEQLVALFFSELSAEMDQSKWSKNIAPEFKKYGQALGIAVSGVSTLLAMPQIATISDGLAKVAHIALQQDSINSLRKQAEKALEKRTNPIIVVLDDVDRLSSEEIREVFKLVRLTASFPNLIYIVLCDRHRVERALGEPEQPFYGRDYLEKIIQWPFSLPEIPINLLEEQLDETIDQVLADIKNPDPLDDEVWDDIHEKIIRPLICNIRDVRRYAFSIRATVAGLEGRVALIDVLALEAVRLFLPDVFRLLPGAIDGLTAFSQRVTRYVDNIPGNADPFRPEQELAARLKDQVDRLINAAKNDRESQTTLTAEEVIDAMIELLFPAGAQLRGSATDITDVIGRAHDEADRTLGKRRVAHEQVFRLYLEQVESPGLLAFYDAERALDKMSDRKELDKFIRSLDPNRWLDVISYLAKFLGQSDRAQVANDREQVECVIIVLLNLWPDIPRQPSNSGIQFRDTEWIVIGDVIGNLLRALTKGEISVEIAVHNIWKEVPSLSCKLRLVRRIEDRMNTKDRLVEPKFAEKFKKKLLNNIHGAAADGLAKEHRILQVLEFAKEVGDSPYNVPDSPELTLSLPRSVRGKTATTPADSNVVQHRPTLNWQRLTGLIGSEDVLKDRINNLKSHPKDPAFQDEAEHLLSLADQYLSGEQTDGS